MSFPGQVHRALPAGAHASRVSLSFLVDTMDKRRGGCAPEHRLHARAAGRAAAADGDGGPGLRRVPPLARGRRRGHVAGAARCRTSSRRRSSAAPTRRTTRSRRSTPARWRNAARAVVPDRRAIADLAIISPNDPGGDDAVRRGVPRRSACRSSSIRASSARGCRGDELRDGLDGARHRDLQRLRVRVDPPEDRHWTKTTIARAAPALLVVTRGENGSHHR